MKMYIYAKIITVKSTNSCKRNRRRAMIKDKTVFCLICANYRKNLYERNQIPSNQYYFIAAYSTTPNLLVISVLLEFNIQTRPFHLSKCKNQLSLNATVRFKDFLSIYINN